MTEIKRASVLLAHGSSDPQWVTPFTQLLAHIREQLPQDGVRTELAFMELASPSLSDTIRRLAAGGCNHIDVLPLFFAAGRHLRRDVPAMLDDLQAALQQQGLAVTIHLHSPVGLEPEVARAISQVVVRQLS
ncbi:MAG: CbiX/SirB N-terminal domain-containing protein [Pseudomonadota bacterium]|nr:CbiX/SirB N-terminal domain-containing protein [Pseudomonadota bacterium]